MASVHQTPPAVEQQSPTSGKAVAIAGELCEVGFEQAISKARSEGRLVFASRLMALRSAVRKASVEDVEREIADRAQRRERMQHEGEVVFKLELPIYTKCEANGRGHFAKRNEGISDIRPTVEMAMRAHASVRRFVCPIPCVVRMTRLCPPASMLDQGGNLASALKKVQDGIADWIRVNDRHAHLVEYVCKQEQQRAGFGVRIEIIAGGKT